jgi:tetratricopeptide (TPR) repeat protein
MTGPANFLRSPGRLLRFFCLAVITVALVLSTPFSALCQLSPVLKEGLDYHRSGKLREAIDVYTEAVEKDPKSAEAYNWRGMAYEDLGELNKALADFSKALEISINYADVYNNRGEVYRKQNKIAEAMSDYSRAASLEKTFAEPHYNMAIILEAQKKNDQALREYETYLKLKPNAPDQQQVTQKVEDLKKIVAATAPPAPAPGAAPAPPGAPPGVAPGAPQQPGQAAPKPPETKPGEAPALPKPGGPRPGAVQIKPPAPPAGIDLGIPGVPPVPITPDMLQQVQAASEALNIVSVLLWLFMAAMLFLIGRKTNTSLPWLAFIPIVQYVQMVRISRKPLWWLALIFLLPILAIPVAIFVGPIDPTGGIITLVLAAIFVLVAIVAWLLVWTAIAAERGKSAIWGVLAWIPCTSPISLGYLGLSK